jgi:hypothetical protein
MEKLLRDSIIWLTCILLMFSGMIFGISINSDSNTLDWFYKVFGSISGLTTIGMFSIAAYALSTWKDQFYHSKLYDNLTEQECIARNTISYLEAYITANKELRLGTDFETTEHYKELKKSSYSNFLGEIEIYRIKVDSIYPLLTQEQEKYFKYSYSKFRQDTHEIRMRVYQLYEINDYKQSEYNLIESDILNLKQDIKSCFRSYWRK